MTDLIRCPSCRGAKKVPKLGGMIGECNMCKGSGQINACDKPVPVKVEPVTLVDNVVQAVSECVPPSDIEHKATIETLPIADVKVNPKKALYKRKKA
jgi:RecJ-like exonuclease